MNRAKVITICGSIKFISEIQYHAERLELEGNCVLSIIYPTRENKDAYTPSERIVFDSMHKQRIDMSDAIYIVNVNGYIGKGTKSEIEYAKKKGKEIKYLVPNKEDLC